LKISKIFKRFQWITGNEFDIINAFVLKHNNCNEDINNYNQHSEVGTVLGKFELMLFLSSKNKPIKSTSNFCGNTSDSKIVSLVQIKNNRIVLFIWNLE
jgi:hypothetical protein